MKFCRFVTCVDSARPEHLSSFRNIAGINSDNDESTIARRFQGFQICGWLDVSFAHNSQEQAAASHWARGLGLQGLGGVCLSAAASEKLSSGYFSGGIFRHD